MSMKKTMAAAMVTTMLALALAGCVDSGDDDWSRTRGNKNIAPNTMNIIGGGVGKDTIARVFQEYGQTTTCKYANGSPCPTEDGWPHDGAICENMKWSVNWRNDHPYEGSDEKYGVPMDQRLIFALQQWADQNTVLRFYWVRYSDTECKFTDNEVVYCVEPADFSKQESKERGCIHMMSRTFPGLNTAWMQGLDYGGPANLNESFMAPVE